MGYIEESLGNEETLLHEAHFHWLYYLGAVVALVVLGILIVGVIVFLYMIIRALTTEIGVTDRRVILKEGWIMRYTEELALTSIEEINLHQGIVGRLLGYGGVTIQGTGAGVIRTPNMMANPVGFRKAIADARGSPNRAAARP